MKYFLFASLLLFQSIIQVKAELTPIKPEEVAVLYNNEIPASKTLALLYAKMRKIPRANLIGLELSKKDEITRSEYNETLRDALQPIFLSRGWWQLARTKEGNTIVGKSTITTLVCMRGVPYKIRRGIITDPSKLKQLKKSLSKPFNKANEASVDSELALLGMPNLPISGPLNNPYYKKDISISKSKLPYFLLVGRIDGPSYAICSRMIGDAIATERRGLWGMCYLDHALKGNAYKMGDDWLDSIETLNFKIGIPTAVDKNRQTFPTNYPMNDAAIYYGWYAAHKNGPLLNPKFKFRRGAIAIHLHSFSAQNLRNAKTNWVGPLLASRAAATVGNVYEPYLALTHHFDILHDRLNKGYSLVEAAYMASPAVSWQGVVLGDPLYRPFLHLNGSGEKNYDDRHYRAIRVANQLWGNDPPLLVKKIRNSAASKSNPLFYEYLGLWHRYKKKYNVAIAFFQTASKKNLLNSNRLRQWLYTADIHRERGNKKLAIATLKKAQTLYYNIPEVKSVVETLKVLDPHPAKKSRKK